MKEQFPNFFHQGAKKYFKSNVDSERRVIGDGKIANGRYICSWTVVMDVLLFYNWAAILKTAYLLFRLVKHIQ
jgi:hypothetical protein